MRSRRWNYISIRKAILIVLTVLAVARAGGGSFAQPGVSRDSIPRDAPAEVRRGIEGLYSEDERARERAARQLGGLGEKATPAVPFLIGLLNEDDFHLGTEISPGQEAIGALVKIGKPAVLPLIAVTADSKADPVARQLAANILGAIKDKRAVEPLIGVLGDQSTRLRMSAITALKQIGDPRAVEPLIERLKDRDSDISHAAALSLKAITGNDLGHDYAKWRAWWQENKAKFLPSQSPVKID